MCDMAMAYPIIMTIDVDHPSFLSLTTFLTHIRRRPAGGRVCASRHGARRAVSKAAGGGRQLCRIGTVWSRHNIRGAGRQDTHRRRTAARFAGCDERAGEIGRRPVRDRRAQRLQGEPQHNHSIDPWGKGHASGHRAGGSWRWPDHEGIAHAETDCWIDSPKILRDGGDADTARDTRRCREVSGKTHTLCCCGRGPAPACMHPPSPSHLVLRPLFTPHAPCFICMPLHRTYTGVRRRMSCS